MEPDPKVAKRRRRAGIANRRPSQILLGGRRQRVIIISGMASLSLTAFETPAHSKISAIIRNRSTNPVDVRAAALHGLQLGHARTILDIGCGFGFMTEAVVPRVRPDAQFVGVDAGAGNEQPYLARLRAAGGQGRFVCRRLHAELSWPDAHFDLVLASYVLYFFPGLLPEVARVLAPDGLLIAITHAAHCGTSLADLIDIPDLRARWQALIGRFSGDNGAALLEPWFKIVERVDYPNALVFTSEQCDELLAYLEFKLRLLAPEVLASEALARAARILAAEGRIVLAKDDVVFRCRQPRCR